MSQFDYSEFIEQIETATAESRALHGELEKFLHDYIDKVVRHVQPDFRESFGVGIVAEHKQHGPVFGFESDDSSGDSDYRVPGSSYYYANDYQSWCKGSSFLEMYEFAQNIPQWSSNGLSRLKEANSNASKSLRPIWSHIGNA